MIFEDYKEYGSLINEVAKSIKHHQIKNLKDEEPTPTDKESVGGEIPLDEVLPPSHGHESGTRVPNTTKKQTYYDGPWIEGELEDRLASLLENIAVSMNDQTATAQRDTRQGKVGIVPQIGHGSGRPGDPRKDDSYHKVKENRRKASEEKIEIAKDSEKMAKEIENLDLDDEADLSV